MAGALKQGRTPLYLVTENVHYSLTHHWTALEKRLVSASLQCVLVLHVLWDTGVEHQLFANALCVFVQFSSSSKDLLLDGETTSLLVLGKHLCVHECKCECVCKEDWLFISLETHPPTPTHPPTHTPTLTPTHTHTPTPTPTHTHLRVLQLRFRL